MQTHLKWYPCEHSKKDGLYWSQHSVNNTGRLTLFHPFGSLPQSDAEVADGSGDTVPTSYGKHSGNKSLEIEIGTCQSCASNNAA